MKIRDESRLGVIMALSLLSFVAFDGRAATFTVSNTADSGAGSLRAAIGAATNGDTITFALPSPSTIGLTSGGLVVNSSLSILGPGTNRLTVSGNGSNQVFSIVSNAVISGLVISNGFPGAAISNQASLTLSNVVLTGNPGCGIIGGGDAADGGGNLALYGCVLSSNSSTALYLQSENLFLNNTTLIGNSGGSGGGLFYLADVNQQRTLAATNCTFVGNRASAGGAMYLGGSVHDALVQFSNVEIRSNSAAAGGGIFTDIGRWTLGNLTVSDNTASGSNSPAYGVDGGSGGGIYNHYSQVTITNANLSGNSAVFGGGGIYGDASPNGYSLTLVSNSVVRGNSASYGGGMAISGFQSPADVWVYNSTFSNNQATGQGGAINSLLAGNNAFLTIVGSTFNNNSASNGGAIYNQAEPDDNFGGIQVIGITNSTLSGNVAALGGAIFNLCLPTNVENMVRSSATLQIFNSTLSGNSATNGGGAILNSNFVSGNAPIEIGSTILNAGQFGGTISNIGGLINSSGYNLSSDDGGGGLINGTDIINTDPKLGPLQDNGGPVFTHALLAGSPAIDQGYNFSGLANDARGLGYAHVR